MKGSRTHAARLLRSRVSSKVAANDDGTVTTVTALTFNWKGNTDSPTVKIIKVRIARFTRQMSRETLSPTSSFARTGRRASVV